MFFTCPTRFGMSPAFAGKINVLFVRASLLKAWTYCSAIDKDAAFLPS